MRTTNLLLIASAAATLASAQIPVVRWLPANHPEAQYAVYSGHEGDRVCRTTVDGVSYAGTLGPTGCVIRLGGPDMAFPNYEAAVGFAKWDFPESTSGARVISGVSQGRNVEVCRARTRAGWQVGWRRTGDSVCSVPNGGNVSNFEALFANNVNETYQLVWSGNGLCAGLKSGNGVSTLLCRDLSPLLWILRQDISGNYLFASQGNWQQCIGLPASGYVEVTPCQQEQTFFKLRPVDDTNYALVGLNGNALAMANGGTADSVRMVPKAFNATDPLQKFEVISHTNAARKLNVLSYNMMLLPVMAFPGMIADHRAEWIVQAIQRDQTRPDVIAIMEAFDLTAFNKLKDTLAGAGYPYFSERPYDFLNAGKGLGTGGVFIASRWPIDSMDNFTYKMGVGADGTASKGVSYARIQKMGQTYHVFATHMQAGDELGVRATQVLEMGNWVRGKIGANSQHQPVIMAGDFNIDMDGHPGEYQFMLDVLQGEFFNAPRPAGAFQPGPGQTRYTTDPATNDIARARGAHGEWIDYVLVHRSAPARSASYRVIEYEANNTYIMSVKHVGENLMDFRAFKDLSDHAALFASFRF